jgi:[acyl-carrier-protein] S-malonyltransferase
VGPHPNLLPATFNRLSNNVTAQTRGWSGLGKRTMSRLVRRPWLTRLLPSSAALLRAPFVEQVILEDWLLEQKVKPASMSTVGSETSAGPVQPINFA